jgi:CheY-like chemotaxis protein
MIETPNSRPLRILVVDDESIVRRVAQQLLSTEGFRVFEAQDGGEALEVLDYMGTVDLVITDIVMPRMDGATFVRELLDAYPDQKVLYMSAHPAEVLVKHSAGLQFPFLAKPFTRAELLSKVYEALGDRRSDPSRTLDRDRELRGGDS